MNRYIWLSLIPNDTIKTMRSDKTNAIKVAVTVLIGGVLLLAWFVASSFSPTASKHRSISGIPIASADTPTGDTVGGGGQAGGGGTGGDSGCCGNCSACCTCH